MCVWFLTITSHDDESTPSSVFIDRVNAAMQIKQLMILEKKRLTISYKIHAYSYTYMTMKSI